MKSGGSNVIRLELLRSSANSTASTNVNFWDAQGSEGLKTPFENYWEEALPPTRTFDQVVDDVLTRTGYRRKTSEVEHEDVAMSDITREEIKAQHEAIEARTDTKIVRLEGKLDLVIQSVQAGREETRESRNAVIASQRGVIANIWVGITIVVAVIVAFFTVTPMYFDQGFHLRETITQELNQRLPPPQPAPQAQPPAPPK